MGGLGVVVDMTRLLHVGSLFEVYSCVYVQIYRILELILINDMSFCVWLFVCVCVGMREWVHFPKHICLYLFMYIKSRSCVYIKLNKFNWHNWQNDQQNRTRSTSAASPEYVRSLNPKSVAVNMFAASTGSRRPGPPRIPGRRRAAATLWYGRIRVRRARRV